MAEILFEAVKPADQTRYARELAAAEPGVLARFLPNRQVEGTTSRSTSVSRTTTPARVRAFDAETPIGKRPAAITQAAVGLAPVGQKLPQTETQIIAQALAEAGDLGEVVSVLYDDTSNNVAAITNLAEQWRGEFLFSGAVSINDNGFIQEADFGLPADHNLSVGDLDAPWDGGGDAIAAELDWVAQVRLASGADPVATIGSTKVLRALLKNVGYTGGEDTRVTPAMFNALRTEWGLPPFVVYDGAVGGVRNTPDDKIAIVTSTVGETQWGITAEELKLIGSRSVESATRHQPRITAATWLADDPVTLWSKANATVLPVAGDIRGLLVAQVIAGTTES